MVTVLSNTVLVQERAVWQQEQALSDIDLEENVELVDALKKELVYLASKRLTLTETEQLKGRAVTIIGDALVPYQVLKQIMAACADSNYRNMSLAVKQIATKQKEAQ